MMHLLKRDLTMVSGEGGAALPVIFFLLVATLYPFGVGPDSAILARTGGGVLWIAALLAAILPTDRLIAPDVDAGYFDQLGVRGIGEEGSVAIRTLAHWISFGPPLMLAAVVAAGLMGLDRTTFLRLEFGLMIGTPGLAALSILTAALTSGVRRAGALAGLLMLPLAIPILIFGAGSLSATGLSAFKLLAACSLVLCAITPFAAGAALRGLRS
jgi:heme exporter protein B